MKITTLLFSATLLLLLNACNSIQVSLPTARVYNPEIPKQSAIQLELNNNAGGNYTLAESPEKRPPEYKPEVNLSSVTSGLLEFGTQDWLSLGVGISVPWNLFGKIQAQILGPNRFSETEGPSLSIFADAGIATDTESGDQKDTFGPGGFNWKGTGSIMGLGTGVSLGYRFNPNFMMYLGYAYQTILTSVTIEQDPADDNSDPGGKYKDKATGRSMNAALGLDFSTRSVSFTPTFEYSEIHWQTTSVHEGKVGGSIVFWLR